MPYKDPEKQKEYWRKYYLKHLEKKKKMNRDWHHANRDRAKSRSRAYRESHREELNAKDRQAYASDPDRYRNESKDYYQKNRKRISSDVRNRERTRQSNKRNPKQAKARTEVFKALKSGRLTKPTKCSRCDKNTDSRSLHGHHKDYDKPLEVEWICSSCHGIEHRKYK